MKLVMHFTLSSRCKTWRTESASTRVSLIPLPSGWKISMANWSRSANGNRRTFRLGVMSDDSNINAMPPPMVIHGCANVKSSTRL